MNESETWNHNCKFYSWEREYPYFQEYCTHHNNFIRRRKTCLGCKGFKEETNE